MPIPDILSGSVPLMEGLRYPIYRFAIIAAGLGVAVALYLFVTATRVGMLVRAGATNAAMVSAVA
jgi:branched-chain amino acid transport system permease protein